MFLKTEHQNLVVYIDDQVNQILSDGGDPHDLLMLLNEIADEWNSFMETFTRKDLRTYCEQYEGFCFFISFINLCSAVSKEFSPTYH